MYAHVHVHVGVHVHVHINDFTIVAQRRWPNNDLSFFSSRLVKYVNNESISQNLFYHVHTIIVYLRVDMSPYPTNFRL